MGSVFRAHARCRTGHAALGHARVLRTYSAELSLGIRPAEAKERCGGSSGRLGSSLEPSSSAAIGGCRSAQPLEVGTNSVEAADHLKGV